MSSPEPEVDLQVRLTPDVDLMASVFREIGETLIVAGESFTKCADRLFELVDDPQTATQRNTKDGDTGA